MKYFTLLQEKNVKKQGELDKVPPAHQTVNI
jgi:hypothetical protein